MGGACFLLVTEETSSLNGISFREGRSPWHAGQNTMARGEEAREAGGAIEHSKNGEALEKTHREKIVPRHSVHTTQKPRARKAARHRTVPRVSALIQKDEKREARLIVLASGGAARRKKSARAVTASQIMKAEKESKKGAITDMNKRETGTGIETEIETGTETETGIETRAGSVAAGENAICADSAAHRRAPQSLPCRRFFPFLMIFVTPPSTLTSSRSSPILSATPSRARFTARSSKKAAATTAAAHTNT